MAPAEEPGGCYAVYVDDKDKVWVSDFAANAIDRFDPADREFREFSERQARRIGAADAGPAGRSLGGGIRRGSAGGRRMIERRWNHRDRMWHEPPSALPSSRRSRVVSAAEAGRRGGKRVSAA